MRTLGLVLCLRACRGWPAKAICAVQIAVLAAVCSWLLLLQSGVR